MRTPRHKRPTQADLNDLRDCHHKMRDLATRLHPATPEYRSLYIGIDAVRTVGIDWTGNPDLWRGGDCSARHMNTTDFIRRPPHGQGPE